MTPEGKTSVFSRNLLDTSEKYPEVPLYVKEACGEGVQSYVLDTEVVAYNRVTGQFIPFQILSTRKKQEETAESATVQIIVQAFDLMYLNGEPLLNKTLQERRDLMLKKFSLVEGKFRYVTRVHDSFICSVPKVRIVLRLTLLHQVCRLERLSRGR